MKKFTITETHQSTSTWIHEVFAETEEQAMEQVMSGESEVIDYSVEDGGEEDPEFNVINAEKVPTNLAPR